MYTMKGKVRHHRTPLQSRVIHEASPGYKKKSAGIWKTGKRWVSDGIWETTKQWVSMDEMPNEERQGGYLSDLS